MLVKSSIMFTFASIIYFLQSLQFMNMKGKVKWFDAAKGFVLL